MSHIKTLRITHKINSNLINKRFDKFIKQNKDFGDDVWGLIKEYAIDKKYINSNYYKVFLRELTYNGFMWKGVKNNWDWEDYHYKVFKDTRLYNRDVYVKYWNNNEMNEYVKLRPYGGDIDDGTSKLLGGWRVMCFREEWKNRRYMCNYYLECKTPYKSISQSEMKQIEEDEEFKRQKEFYDFIERRKQFRIKLNTDRYNELKHKINKTIRNARNRKNKNWSKSINVFDNYQEDVEHFYTTPQTQILFGKRFGSFIWGKTDDWKIYKIHERWIEYNSATRRRYELNNNYDRAYLRLKNIEEYITPIRDINTHHKSWLYKYNKTLITDILETS